MVANLFGPILKQVLGAGASPSTIQRIEEKKPETEVNNAFQATSSQELKQLSAPKEITTAPSTVIMPEVLPVQPLTSSKQERPDPVGMRIEFSEEAIKSLHPLALTLGGLFKSLLPGDLKELVNTAKHMLIKALTQVSSSPTDTPAAAKAA